MSNYRHLDEIYRVASTKANDTPLYFFLGIGEWKGGIMQHSTVDASSGPVADLDDFQKLSLRDAATKHFIKVGKNKGILSIVGNADDAHTHVMDNLRVVNYQLTSDGKRIKFEAVINPKVFTTKRTAKDHPGYDNKGAIGSIAGVDLNPEVILENHPLDAAKVAAVSSNAKKIAKSEPKATPQNKAAPESSPLKPTKPTIGAPTTQAAPSLTKDRAGKKSIKLGGDVKDYYEVQYSMDSLRMYIAAITPVLEELDNKIKRYGMNIDRPVDIPLQVENLKRLDNELLSVAEKALPSAKSTTPSAQKGSHVLNMKFNDEFKLRDLKLNNYRHPDAPIFPFAPFNAKKKIEKYITATNLSAGHLTLLNRENNLSEWHLFRNQTTNSLFVFAKEIYARYCLVPGARFRNADDCRSFLKKYVYPGPDMTNFALTKTAIEGFLLGDVRLLDDNFYKKSRPSRAAISARAKAEARNAVATQYEKIGDVLGDKFIQGKFEDIDDLDDLYSSVLNHLPVPELIRIAAQCLLKMVGLDELKRQFCKDAILKYREYQEDIIEYVASAGAGGQRVALKLRELFDALDAKLQQGVVKAVDIGVKKIGNAIAEAQSLSTWRKEENIDLLIANLTQQGVEKEELLLRTDDSFVNPNLDKKLAEKEKKLQAINSLIAEQVEREKLLGDRLPPNEKGLKDQYISEADEVRAQITSLSGVIKSSTLQVEVYGYLIHELIPSLRKLNPFAGIPQANATSLFQENSRKQMIKYGVSAEKIEIAANKMLVATPYVTAEPALRRQMFKNLLLPLLDDVMSFASKQEKAASGPAKAAFKEKTKEAASAELSKLLDGDDGLIVCAAVFAVVPAAAYALYYVISNWDEYSKAIAEDGAKVAAAAKKRVEILLSTEYPVVDLLEGFKEAIYDLGMNLARDLILSGIMYLARELKAACSDSEKANAPYNPLGKIDLSAFIASSARSGSTEIKDSNGYNKLLSTTEITVDQYLRVLDAISGAFTISEINAFMSQSASRVLYAQLLQVLEDQSYLKETKFYELYVNEDGIHVLAKIISADINREMLVEAKETFDKEKRILLNICTATNEEIKALELSQFMTRDEVLKSLAELDAHRHSLLGKALKNVGEIMASPITPTQLCGPKDDETESGGKIKPYHPSQKSANKKAADAIFGNVEKVFEYEVSRVKDIYREVYDIARPAANGVFLPPYGSKYGEADRMKDLRSFAMGTATGLAAPKIATAVASLVNPKKPEEKNAFFIKSSDGGVLFNFNVDRLKAGKKSAKINKRINFIYSPEAIEIPSHVKISGSLPSALLQTFTTLAGGAAINYQSPIYKQLQQFGDPATIDWSDPELQTLGSEFRKKYDILMKLPEYEQVTNTQGISENVKTKDGGCFYENNFLEETPASDDYWKVAGQFASCAEKAFGLEAGSFGASEFLALQGVVDSFLKWLGEHDTLEDKLRHLKYVANFRAWCSYLHGEAKTPVAGSNLAYSKAAAEAGELGTAAVTEEAINELKIFFPENEKANILLRVVSTEKLGASSKYPLAYEYAAQNPPVIEDFQAKYVSGSFNYGRFPTDFDVTMNNHLERFVKENDLYVLALNEMFHDLLLTTSRNGLFLDQGQTQDGDTLPPTLRIFEKLRLTKNLPETAASSCFLGFFNKKVLAAQVEKLSEDLSCYTGLTPGKSSTNIAYVKIALDCVIRTIVVKEMMKSLFVFGFTEMDSLYSYNWTSGNEDGKPKAEPFFNRYLSEEIERAIKRQFETVAGGGVDDFYSDIIEEFILDLMRLLYQDETLTAKDAFNIIVKDQIQFVKDVLTGALPAELYNTPGFFDRRVLQQVTISPKMQSSPAEAATNAQHLKFLDGVDMSDQLRVLQNDQLTHYTNTMNPGTRRPFFSLVGNTGDGQFEEGIDRTTKIGFISQDSLPVDNRFVLKRHHTRALRDYSVTPPVSIETTNLEEAAGGVNSGFVTEKMVEIKYNSSFWTNMSERQRNMLRRTMQLWAGQWALSEAFLNETKFIMLMPQVRSYVKGESSGAPEAVDGVAVPLPGWSISAGIFWNVFRFNFDPSLTAAEKVAFMKYYPGLDWSLTGKIYINDFEALVRDLRYPFPPGELGSTSGMFFDKDGSGRGYRDFYGMEAHPDGKEFQVFSSGGVQKGLDSVIPNPQKIKNNKMNDTYMQQMFSAMYHGIASPTDTGHKDALDILRVMPREEVVRLKPHESPTGKAGDFNQISDTWYTLLPDSEKLDMLKLGESLGLPEWAHYNFFTWFFTLPVASILDIKFITRISQYVAEKDVPDIQEMFWESPLGADSVATPQKSSAEQALFLLKEKTGRVDLKDSDTFFLGINPQTEEEMWVDVDLTHPYVTFPVYTVAAPTPPDQYGTWFDFMYKIHKRSYKTQGEAYKAPKWDDFFDYSLTKDLLTSEEYYALFEAFMKRPGAPGQGNFPGDLEWPWLDMFTAEFFMNPAQALDNNDWKKNWNSYNNTIHYNGIIGEINWNAFRRSSSGEGDGGDAMKWDIGFDIGLVGGVAAGVTWGRERFNRYWYEDLIQPYLSNKKYVGKNYYGLMIGEDKVPTEDGDKGTYCFPTGDEAVAAMKKSYLQTLNETIYSPDLAQDLLYPIARKVVAYLKSRGSDALTEWFDEREEIIHERTWQVAPWNPSYDFTDPNWVSTRLLQEFLYSLQLTHFGIEIITEYVNNPYHTKEYVNPAFVGPNAPPITWDMPVRQYLPNQPMAGGEVETLAQLLGFQALSVWVKTGKHETIGALGNQPVDDMGTVIDILGNVRGYPYEYNNTTFEDLATMGDVLFDPKDPKKDIYTMVSKFVEPNVTPAEAMGKILAGAPPAKKEEFRSLMQTFFLKEQSTILILVHRLLVEKFYPEMEDNFNTTLATSTQTLLTAISIANGNYQHNPSPNGDRWPDFDFGALGMTVLKAFLGAMANTVDPFWKTPWIWQGGPGPFTPFGIAAKLLNAKGSMKDVEAIKRERPSGCDHLIEDQAKKIKYGPLLDKPSDES